MPLIKINIIKGRSKEEKEALKISVYSALTEALKRPDLYRSVIIYEHEGEDFLTPHDATKNFTSIEIQLFAGKSDATKRRIYQTIIRNLSELGFAANDVFIVLHQIPPSDIGMRGGIPANEIFPDYRPEV
jgi:phenylpyruvate tautomerase PptA (4-oxalocrotonate tautomerase family)